MQTIQHGIDSAEKLGWISEEEADQLLDKEITDKLQSAELGLEDSALQNIS